MDFTLITDCGAHAVKFAGHSKRNRRKDWAEGQVKEMPTACPHSSAGTMLDRFYHMLPQLLAREVAVGEELTLVLLVDTFATRSARESLLQLAFEHAGAKKVAMCFTAATALFTAGTTSGVCVDIGFSGATITPVHDGVAITWMSSSHGSHVGCSAVDANLLQGLDVTRHPVQLATLARDPEYTLAKSRVCSVGSKVSRPAENGDDRVGECESELHFTLPDGAAVCVPLTAARRSTASRGLLYAGSTSVPVSFAAVYQEFAVEYPRAHQWTCVGGGAAVAGVSGELAGALGGCLFGLPDRQLAVRNPVTAAVEGALILTHLSTFKAMCVSVGEYEEAGPSQCVHVKSVDFR